MKPALLVIDIQKEFFEIDQTTAISLNEAVEYTNAVIEIFRKKNLPVIVIQHKNEKNKLVPGEKGFELPDQLNIAKSDLHIHKTYSNAFTKTPLLEKLKQLDIDTVILTGFCAEYCVLSTYRGAQDHDLTPVMLRSALASSTPKNIAFVEEISNIISIKTLEKFLN